MTTFSYTVGQSKNTPQSKPIPGRENEMAPNNAGGFAFKIDDFSRLDRFLILGTESNTYYTSREELTQNAAESVIRAIKADGIRVVNRIVEISESGRAPKNEPALYALALSMTFGDDNAKNVAYNAIPKVARIGTHILRLAEYVHSLRGWGRGVRRGFSKWYNEKTPMQLAYQMTKYAQRNGWSHRDILRLAHVHPLTSSHDALFTKAVGKTKEVVLDEDVANYLSAIDVIQKLAENPTSRNITKIATLISAHSFPREVLPTNLLSEPKIWEALLSTMGLEALVRNLGTMSRTGLFDAYSSATTAVIDRLGNQEIITKSKLHPIKALSALNTYSRGVGVRSDNTWTVNQKIVDALNDLFYATFGNVQPTGKKMMLALDVSGSMGWSEIAGVPGLTPQVASAAMAMITARVESDYEIFGFGSSLKPIAISPNMRLTEVISEMNKINMGATDCALPMQWATNNKVQIDGFVVYTDNETWVGAIHPSKALRTHRNKLGVNSKLAVVGMTATEFSIADPKDSGMLDVVGFDSAAPALMSDFMTQGI